MTPYYQDNWTTIYHGDCREAELENISAVVTDPPYELGFMGKKWDSTGVSYQAETWQKIRGFCLSGSPLMAFGGTRTFHRIACAIEDAGWEIRDTIMWVYGSGFPKSLNIGKAVDKVLGNEREAYNPGGRYDYSFQEGNSPFVSETATHSGKRVAILPSKGSSPWEGYGTALKPAYEPILLCMNPLDGTFAENALKHRVAGLNIDQCRVPIVAGIDDSQIRTMHRSQKLADDGWGMNDNNPDTPQVVSPQGRFPANFIHDGSQMVLELFPETAPSGGGSTGGWQKRYVGGGGISRIETTQKPDNGSAARFFYCAKASKAERDRGCEGLEPQQPDPSRKEGNPGGDNPRNRGVHKVRNNHPTVKPLALMEYLVKLVKMPEYNLILDPFMGSGTTLLACIRLGLPCIGIDNDEHSCEIAARRCDQGVLETP